MEQPKIKRLQRKIPIKHDLSRIAEKCKSKKNCFAVTKKGDNLIKLRYHEPLLVDERCKRDKCFSVIKKGDDLTILQCRENSSQSSDDCDNTHKPCLIVTRKGDDIPKLHTYEPGHELKIIQHCEGNNCHKLNYCNDSDSCN